MCEIDARIFSDDEAEVKEIVHLFDEMIALQERKLLQFARQVVPNVTEDDILQPNDFPHLENHPFFRYEEGVLKGLHSARMAYLAHLKDQGC